MANECRAEIAVEFFDTVHDRSTDHHSENRTPKVKNRDRGAVYPPKTSVSLFSSLFKSLSVLRCSAIFSTECSTVV